MFRLADIDWLDAYLSIYLGTTVSYGTRKMNTKSRNVTD